MLFRDTQLLININLSENDSNSNLFSFVEKHKREDKYRKADWQNNFKNFKQRERHIINQTLLTIHIYISSNIQHIFGFFAAMKINDFPRIFLKLLTEVLSSFDPGYNFRWQKSYLTGLWSFSPKRNFWFDPFISWKKKMFNNHESTWNFALHKLLFKENPQQTFEHYTCIIL